jgi:hypothetical protein
MVSGAGTGNLFVMRGLSSEVLQNGIEASAINNLVYGSTGPSGISDGEVNDDLYGLALSLRQEVVWNGLGLRTSLGIQEQSKKGGYSGQNSTCGSRCITNHSDISSFCRPESLARTDNFLIIWPGS